MKPSRYLAVFLLTLVPASSSGQSRQAPVSRMEILGRLALGQPPSSTAHAVKTRGIGFGISDDFLSLVKLAGGDGILFEKLSAAGPSEVPDDQGGSDGSYEHLGKCAEYLHIGDVEKAGDECWVAMDENPRSLWPIFATLRALEERGATKDEKEELIRRTTEVVGDAQRARGAISGAHPYGFALSLLAQSTPVENAAQYDGIAATSYQYGEVPPTVDPVTSGTAPDEEKQTNPRLRSLLASDQEVASIHSALADCYEQDGDLDKALHEYQEALRLEPENPQVHEIVARFYQTHENFEEELVELREAVRIAPYGFVARWDLTQALERQGRIEDAIHEWRDLTELSPGNEQASINLVEAYTRQNDWKSAIAECKRFLEVKPDSPEMENELAWSYATATDPKYRNPAEALAMAKRAVETSEQPVANYLDTLAEALLINGHPEEALEAEQRAVDPNSDDPEMQARLKHFQEAAEKAKAAQAK